MDRILLNKKVEIGKEVILEGPPLEALKIQGLRVGNLLTLTDHEGNDLRGRIIQISKEKASIIIFDAFSSSTESPLEIILLQALPQKERMEWIIQKTTELGISSIIPFKSQKSISLEEREFKQKKAHRWQDIAIKATKQSRRAMVPSVKGYCSFEDAIKFCEGEGLKILLWEREGKNLKNILKQNPLHKIYVMVGPEGGFTEEEVKLAIAQGFIPVKLGQRILRTETASIALIAILQYELGDIG